jgi:P27 family predicted phage terminase small subunit
MTAKRPPKHLSRESKNLWRTITYEYELDNAGMLLLKVMLESYDRLMQARTELKHDGIVYETPSGYKKAHPALSIEKDARSGFLQAWRQLNLDIEPPGSIGRPPGS